MKKNYTLKIFALLLIICMGFSISLFSQINLPFQSDFSGVGGESDDSSSNMPGITATTMPAGFLFAGSQRIYAGGQKLKFDASNEVGILPTDLIVTGGAPTIEVKFNAIAWPAPLPENSKTATINLVYGDQTIEIIVDKKEGASWPIIATDLIEYSCQFNSIPTPTSLFIKSTTGSGTNEYRIFLDNVRITEAGDPTQVAVPTFSPTGGVYTAPIDVTINCSTPDAIIRYTLNGDDPTESSTLFSTPIPVTEQITIKAKAWKDGLDPSAIGTATYTFPQGVTTLAALRALAPEYNGGTNTGTTTYLYTGEAVVTHIQSNNNVKYVQDETAAIMIFDPSNKIGAKEIGDKITNLTGTITNYFGMLELMPTEGCTDAGWDNKVPTTVITASQLDLNHENSIQAKVITIKDVFFTTTGNYATGTYYNLKENNVVYDSVVYTDNWAADYMGQNIPTLAVNLSGVILFKGGTTFAAKNRIVPLDNSNDVILGIETINPSVIKLSPNPANSYVNILTDNPMKLEVYSILGNLIAVEQLREGKNTIFISQYPAGLYMMKMIDQNTGQTFVQKLVVQ